LASQCSRAGMALQVTILYERQERTPLVFDPQNYQPRKVGCSDGDVLMILTKLRTRSRILNVVALVGLVLSGTVSGCGSGTDLGKYLAISVQPASVFIVSGSGYNCSDIQGAYENQSVSPNRAYFSNFKLEWKDTNRAFITIIRATIDSPYLSGVYKFELSDTELALLLGKNGGEINGAQTINSNDLSKPVPCGIHLGGISVPANSPSFKAKVKFEVYGYSIDSAGNQSPIKQTTEAMVEYLN
jgi:hypothetical protein